MGFIVISGVGFAVGVGLGVGVGVGLGVGLGAGVNVGMGVFTTDVCTSGLDSVILSIELAVHPSKRAINRIKHNRVILFLIFNVIPPHNYYINLLTSTNIVNVLR